MNGEFTTHDRWMENMPVTLRQLSEVQGVSYSTVKSWAADVTFPRVGKFLRRSDFDDWWKKSARRRNAARRLHPTADKPDAQPQNCDLPAALPLRAALRIGAIG